MVYIMEAHAVDEWPVAMAAKDFTQHRSIEERLSAAQTFLGDFTVSPNLPVFADGIDNAFNSAYASWPFRWWVLTPESGSGSGAWAAATRARVAQKPMPRHAAYDVGELEAWLQEDHRRRGRPA